MATSLFFLKQSIDAIHVVGIQIVFHHAISSKQSTHALDRVVLGFLLGVKVITAPHQIIFIVLTSLSLFVEYVAHIRQYLVIHNSPALGYLACLSIAKDIFAIFFVRNSSSGSAVLLWLPFWHFCQVFVYTITIAKKIVI